MMNKRHEDKGFYRQLFTLALPIAFQNLVFTFLNMTDNLMIGQFGEDAIAGVGAANRVFFLFNLLIFGINSGAVIFTSQFWGIKDIKNIRRVLGFALTLTVIGSIPFSIGAVLVPEQIISIINRDPEVVKQGASYLRVMGFSYLATAISFSFMFALRAIGKALIPMVTSTICVAINIVLNALLIFGLFGFPRLGVVGAAVATTIARIIEMLLILTVIYTKKLPLAAKLSELFDWKKELISKVVLKILPVVANEVFWSVGITMYSIIYGHIGKNQLAAITILGTVEQLGMVLFIGMGNACAVMLGNAMGNNELDKAWHYGKKFALLSLIGSVIMGVVIYGFAPIYLTWFNVKPIVLDYVRGCLMIYILILPFRVFNTLNIIGFLRSGGDTIYALILDVLGVWLVAVPLGWFGYYMGWPLYIVYLLVMGEEVFKFFLGVPRFLSKKWVNNLVSVDEN